MIARRSYTSTTTTTTTHTGTGGEDSIIGGGGGVPQPKWRASQLQLQQQHPPPLRTSGSVHRRGSKGSLMLLLLLLGTVIIGFFLLVKGQGRQHDAEHVVGQQQQIHESVVLKHPTLQTLRDYCRTTTTTTKGKNTTTGAPFTMHIPSSSSSSFGLEYETLSTLFCASTAGDEYWYDDEEEAGKGGNISDNNTSSSSRVIPVYVDPMSTVHVDVRPLSMMKVTPPGSSPSTLDIGGSSRLGGGGTGGGVIQMHRASAVWFLDPEAAYSVYHLVADSLVAFLVWFKEFLTLLRIGGGGEADAMPFYVPLIRADSRHSENRLPCSECTRIATILDEVARSAKRNNNMNNNNRPRKNHAAAAASGAGGRGGASSRLGEAIIVQATNDNRRQADGPTRTNSVDMHCFCSAVVVPRMELPLTAATHRHRGYLTLHRALRESGIAEAAQSTTSPVMRQLWLEKAAPRNVVPRLLIIQRRASRRIGNISTFVQMGTLIGFDARVMELEGLSTEDQMGTFLSADVVMLTHGMAMGWAHLLAADGGSGCPPSLHRHHPARSRVSGGDFGEEDEEEDDTYSFRKTIIELQHRVRDFPDYYRFGENVARDNRLNYILVRADHAVFGPKVLDPVAEDEALMDETQPIQNAMTSVGFHDQTAYFRPKDVYQALKGAWRRFHEPCRG